jgi:hypothetical integral membrane protein (TIGR02206 family)
MSFLYELLWQSHNRFTAFGVSHLTALCLFATLSILLMRFGRSSVSPRMKTTIRVGLGLCILIFETLYVLYPLPIGTFDVRYSLPFQVCDIAAYATAIALITNWAIPREISCYLGLTTTLIACFTPDIVYDLPHIEYICFFASHALVVAAVLYMTIGLSQWPNPGAARRVFFFINAYAILMILVNLSIGSNYIYLRSTPQVASPMEWLGPWPYYVVVMDVLFIEALAVVSLAMQRLRHRVLSVAAEDQAAVA